MKRKRRGFGLWLGIWCLCAAGAAASPVPPPVIELPEIVVTPTRGPTEVQQAPAAVTRVDLRTGGPSELARSTPEALREVPSTMVQKTAQGMGSPYLRGFTGFRTLALVDDIRLNNSVFREGPNQYWATIDSNAVRRFEVVGGPASVLYGSDAIGGAMNALPVEPPAWSGKPRWGGRVAYRGATAENANGLRLEYGGRGAAEYGALLGFTQNEFGDVRGGRDVGRQPHTGYSEWGGDARVVLEPDRETRLTLAHQSFRQDDVWRTHRTVYGITWKGLKRGDDLEHVFDQARDLTYARLEMKPSAFGAANTFTVYRHAQSEDLRRVRADGRRDAQGFDVAAWGASALARRTGTGGRWTAGAEYQADVVDSYARQYDAAGALKKIEIQGPVADDALYHLAGVFLQHQLPLDVEERFEVVTGARYTFARAEADRLKDPITGKPVRLADDWQNIVGSLRGVARLGERGRSALYAGVSQGFRAPNLSDLTRLDMARSNELETPAPQLDPENYVAVEMGARLDLAPLQLEAAAYRTWIDGMIVRAPTGRVFNDGFVEVTKRNAGDGYVHGIEARAELALTREWSLWSQAAWMEGTVDGYPDSTTEKRREPVSRLLPATARIGLTRAAENGKWWVEAVGEAAAKADRLSAGDRRDTQRIPPGGTPGYAVAHLRCGAKISENLRFVAGVENVLDKDYRIHGSGVNEPGRNFVVSSVLEF